MLWEDSAMQFFEVILMMIFAYGLGSIPFGLLITRIAGLGDIRLRGSGNIGATNVLRTGRMSLALLTLVLDAAKGMLALGLSRTWLGHSSQFSLPSIGADVTLGCVVICVVCGHIFPVWLKGKGGKGFATILGVLVVACPWAAALSLVIWLGVALITRYSSLAALVTISLLPAWGVAWQTGVWGVTWFAIALLVFWTHRTNIKRLWRGHEPKIGQKAGQLGSKMS